MVCKEMDLTYKESHEEKILYIIVMIIVVVIIFGVIVLLRDQPKLLKDILVPLITLIIGGAGGYGFGYGRGRKENLVN